MEKIYIIKTKALELKNEESYLKIFLLLPSGKKNWNSFAFGKAIVSIFEHLIKTNLSLLFLVN